MKKVVIPKAGERIKTSLIGSGKISRRCLIKPFGKEKSRSEKLHENLFKRSKEIPYREAKKPITKPLKFPTSSSKIIFGYWNNLGHPFVRHNPVKSKVTSKGINRIERATKKHGKESVLNAISTIEKVFNSGWFKWRLIIDSQKISLHYFFAYSDKGHKEHSKRIKDLPLSWFKECLKGFSYMEKKYSIVKKDKHPHITEKLLYAWYEYRKARPPRKEKEQLKIVAKKLSVFCSNNEFDWMTVTDIIYGMLNEWHTYKPKHTGYLLSDIFWDDVLRREIIRYGVVDSDFKWTDF